MSIRATQLLKSIGVRLLPTLISRTEQALSKVEQGTLERAASIAQDRGYEIIGSGPSIGESIALAILQSIQATNAGATIPVGSASPEAITSWIKAVLPEPAATASKDKKQTVLGYELDGDEWLSEVGIATIESLARELVHQEGRALNAEERNAKAFPALTGDVTQTNFQPTAAFTCIAPHSYCGHQQADCSLVPGGSTRGEQASAIRDLLSSEVVQTAVTICERCADYDKTLEQYAAGAGKTINQLWKALKEATRPADYVRGIRDSLQTARAYRGAISSACALETLIQDLEDLAKRSESARPVSKGDENG